MKKKKNKNPICQTFQIVIWLVVPVPRLFSIKFHTHNFGRRHRRRYYCCDWCVFAVSLCALPTHLFSLLYLHFNHNATRFSHVVGGYKSALISFITHNHKAFNSDETRFRQSFFRSLCVCLSFFLLRRFRPSQKDYITLEQKLIYSTKKKRHLHRFNFLFVLKRKTVDMVQM